MVLPNRMLVWVGTLFSGWMTMIVCGGLAIYLAIEGSYGWAIYVGVAAFGLTSFASPGMWVMTALGARSNQKNAPKIPYC